MRVPLIGSPEMRQKALEARVANAQARRENTTLRGEMSFAGADRANWDELARQYKVTLTPWGEAPSNGKIETFLRKLKLTTGQYSVWIGSRRVGLGFFAEKNPTWPMRALEGTILESTGLIKKMKEQDADEDSDDE